MATNPTSEQPSRPGAGSQVDAGLEKLSGELERIVFSGDESGYTVLRVHAPRQQDLVTVVGSLPGVQPGERLDMEGRWVNHPKYGLQFQVVRYTSLLPASSNAIKRYLSSRFVKGIGPVMAGRLVDLFGEDTLEVIESNPERLVEVEGIGPTRASSIEESWEAQKEVRNVMIFLQGHGVSSAYAIRIYRAYGHEAIGNVRNNPYRLAQDIRGIGFKTADRIAQDMGIDPHSPFRAQAAIEYTLSQLADQGHMYAPMEELISDCAQRVDIPEEILADAADSLKRLGRIIVDEDAVYLRALYIAERGVAEAIKALMEDPDSQRAIDAERAVAWAQKRVGLELTGRQAEAIQMAVSQKFSIVTGGPGTGKTTILRSVLLVLEALKLKVELAAPTGRAAKRMAEATGRGARTLHRLLDFRPGEGKFHHDQDNPLKADVVVVDETSMVDTVLMYHLLRAVPRDASVLLVGDVDQLPSVGPGSVLRDMLDSGTIPFVSLTDIFRQGDRSQIVEQAHRINQGSMPRWPRDLLSPSDFYVITADDPDKVADLVVDLCAVRIPRRFGFDPMREIQALCPMNRGSVGTSALNSRLQEILNPEGPAVTRFGRTFKTGDKVLQTVNDYDKDVFNGDLGWITELDLDAGTLSVTYDDKETSYDFSELDELMPAYAISVHRSQGSEYPAVVVPVTTQHYPLLQRNLLYTAVTRGRQLVALVGSSKALAIAVRNRSTLERHTGLKELLSG
ncbi:MAG: ATP-dependent RecD-like DNA helicase [SAR202 cluster bacterium]|nr:ATP-dependent RecD-like DNA helicase [SAR202 cluster bacterium]